MTDTLPTWTARFDAGSDIISLTQGPPDEHQPPHVYIDFGGIAVVTVSADTADHATQAARQALTQDTQERRHQLDAAWREDTITRTEDEEYGGWWPITNRP